MEIETKGKIRIKTWKEKKALCEEWKNSGKSKTLFCKGLGIPLGTFAHWCGHLWPSDKKSASNILPVKIINKAIKSQGVEVEQTEIKLTLGINTTICFKLPIKSLVTFIQELTHAVATIR